MDTITKLAKLLAEAAISYTKVKHYGVDMQKGLDKTSNPSMYVKQEVKNGHSKRNRRT